MIGAYRFDEEGLDAVRREAERIAFRGDHSLEFDAVNEALEVLADYARAALWRGVPPADEVEALCEEVRRQGEWIVYTAGDGGKAIRYATEEERLRRAVVAVVQLDRQWQAHRLLQLLLDRAGEFGERVATEWIGGGDAQP
jgi:hypothetical protein